MASYGIDEAYQLLMSPQPYAQSSGGAMVRNFGSAAQMMAGYLRQTAEKAVGAGDAGRATAEQALRHAGWFDQVAQNSSDAANQLDKLAAAGNGYQATAENVYQGYQAALNRASGPNVSPEAEVTALKVGANGGQVLSGQVDDWGQNYSSFKMPTAPPAPAAAGSGSPSGSGAAGPSGYTSGSSGGNSYSGGGGHSTALIGAGGVGTGAVAGGATLDRGPGVAGSVEVGPDGGQFAGWYQDPRTGYYVDPSSGREFDPVSSRWVDPITGQPFGQVTPYATGLQGLGGAATTGGLLSDTAGTAGASLAGVSGAGGGFAGLFSAGNTAGIAAGYGGMLPPSLASGSAATGTLWQQAERDLGVKQQVAGSLVAREQAVRAGRPYMPPTQAGMGAGGIGGSGRGRPGYLTAEEEEAGLFSSPRGRLAAGAAAAEEEAAAGGGRRAYLPPGQAGAGKQDKRRGRERPDWLVDDDMFTIDPAHSGVLGD